MKKLLLSIFLIVVIPINLAFSEDIIPEKVEISAIPKSLSILIDRFITAVNLKKHGNIQILTLDVKPTFLEIKVPEGYISPLEPDKEEAKIESIFKVDNNCYILLYKSDKNIPSIEAPTAVWIMGKNSWHIDSYGEPLSLAIPKLNIRRAMKDIEIGNKTP